MKPDPNCQYCLGAGVRHNGYFEYPCTCLSRNFVNYLMKDSGFKAAPIEEFELKNINDKLNNAVDISMVSCSDCKKWIYAEDDKVNKCAYCGSENIYYAYNYLAYPNDDIME